MNDYDYHKKSAEQHRVRAREALLLPNAARMEELKALWREEKANEALESEHRARSATGNQGKAST